MTSEETLELFGGEQDGRLIRWHRQERLFRVPRAPSWGELTKALRADEAPTIPTIDVDEYEAAGRTDRGHLRMRLLPRVRR